MTAVSFLCGAAFFAVFYIVSDLQLSHGVINESYLLVSTWNDGIFRMNLDGSNLQQVLNSSDTGTLVRGLAVDYEGGLMYFSSLNDGFIKRATLDGADVTTISTQCNLCYRGMAYDWIRHKLYWANERTIEVYDVATENITLVYSGGARIYDVVVDPFNGMMYWTDWGRDTIYSGSTDGVSSSPLHNTDLDWPDGITLDHSSGRLFWADDIFDRIEASLTNGSDRMTLLSSEDFIDVFFHAGILYHTQGNPQEAGALNVSSNTVTTLAPFSLPQQITVVSSPLTADNAICGDFTCTCNDGFGGNICADIDECSGGLAICSVNAECTNIPGSYFCICSLGFSGDGINCMVNIMIRLDPEETTFVETVTGDINIRCELDGALETDFILWRRQDGASSPITQDGFRRAELDITAGEGGLRPEDAGFYECIAQRGSATVSVTVEIIVLEPVDEGSSAFLRFSTVNLTTIQELVEFPIPLEVLELELAQVMRDIYENNVTISAILFPTCSQVQNRDIDDANSWLRFECRILESPMSNRTLNITEQIAESLPFNEDAGGILTDPLVPTSAFGFCDYSVTSSNAYGVNSWSESLAGDEVILACQFGEAVAGGTARRQCTANANWQDPDFSQCNRSRTCSATSNGHTVTVECTAGTICCPGQSREGDPAVRCCPDTKFCGPYHAGINNVMCISSPATCPVRT